MASADITEMGWNLKTFLLNKQKVDHKLLFHISWISLSKQMLVCSCWSISFMKTIFISSFHSEENEPLWKTAREREIDFEVKTIQIC